VNSSNLTSNQSRRIRARLAPMITYVGKLVKRCRELEYWEDDPLLLDAVRAQQALNALDRECMRAALKHGDDKRALDMSERDISRA
jgi:hypothetical protein